MNTFIRFFYEFISIFFDGVVMIFKVVVEGFTKMFNFPEYSKIISNYSESFTTGENFEVNNIGCFSKLLMFSISEINGANNTCLLLFLTK